MNGSHYLAPADFATIYDIAPLVPGGNRRNGPEYRDCGTIRRVASDLAAFRTRYNLPANTPKMILYGADPGFTDAQD